MRSHTSLMSPSVDPDLSTMIIALSSRHVRSFTAHPKNKRPRARTRGLDVSSPRGSVRPRRLSFSGHSAWADLGEVVKEEEPEVPSRRVVHQRARHSTDPPRPPSRTFPEDVGADGRLAWNRLMMRSR